MSRSISKILLGLCCLSATAGFAETHSNQPVQPKEVPASTEANPEDAAPAAGVYEAKGNSSPADPSEGPREGDNQTPAAGIQPTPSPAALQPAGPPPEFRGPDVTLIAGEERTVHEYRHNGQLRMIKVVPKRGKPYYLVPRDPTRGWGDLEQAEALQAEWVLWEF